MECNDDIFIIIVDDNVNNSSEIKQEACTEDLAHEDIDAEYLDSKFEGPIKGLSLHNDSDQDNVIPIVNRDDTISRKRTRMVKNRQSYVQRIKDHFPELEKNEELLITSLVADMKATKPPPLPTDYYVMDGTMLQCTQCGHQSVSIPAASRHYQEKHGERYLYCFACGVNFRSKTNLYKHEKHCVAPDASIVLKARAMFLGAKGRSRPFLSEDQNGKRRKAPKKFHCTECSASFTSKDSITAHRYMHAGLLPFVCWICLRGYTSNISLTRHRKAHHDDEQYICDHCQKSFKAKKALIVHLNTHKPLKPFPCAECERRFAQRFALLLHVDRQHRGLPPPCACELCPRRYPRMSLLKTHMMKVHGMQIMTRTMFMKALPTISNLQVEQAKLIMKRELVKTEVKSEPVTS